MGSPNAPSHVGDKVMRGWMCRILKPCVMANGWLLEAQLWGLVTDIVATPMVWCWLEKLPVAEDSGSLGRKSCQRDDMTSVRMIHNQEKNGEERNEIGGRRSRVLMA